MQRSLISLRPMIGRHPYVRAIIGLTLARQAKKYVVRSLDDGLIGFVTQALNSVKNVGACSLQFLNDIQELLKKVH